jgi:hypothetical protein
MLRNLLLKRKLLMWNQNLRPIPQLFQHARQNSQKLPDATFCLLRPSNSALTGSSLKNSKSSWVSIGEDWILCSGLIMRKLKVNKEDAKTKIKTQNQKTEKNTHIHKHRKKEQRSLQHQFPCVIQQSIEILEDLGWPNLQPNPEIPNSNNKKAKKRKGLMKSQQQQNPNKTKSEWKSEEFEREKKKHSPKLKKNLNCGALSLCPFLLLLLILQKTTQSS